MLIFSRSFFLVVFLLVCFSRGNPNVATNVNRNQNQAQAKPDTPNKKYRKVERSEPPKEDNKRKPESVNQNQEQARRDPPVEPKAKHEPPPQPDLTEHNARLEKVTSNLNSLKNSHQEFVAWRGSVDNSLKEINSKTSSVKEMQKKLEKRESVCDRRLKEQDKLVSKVLADLEKMASDNSASMASDNMRKQKELISNKLKDLMEKVAKMEEDNKNLQAKLKEMNETWVEWNFENVMWNTYKSGKVHAAKGWELTVEKTSVAREYISAIDWQKQWEVWSDRVIRLFNYYKLIFSELAKFLRHQAGEVFGKVSEKGGGAKEFVSGIDYQGKWDQIKTKTLDIYQTVSEKAVIVFEQSKVGWGIAQEKMTELSGSSSETYTKVSTQVSEKFQIAKEFTKEKTTVLIQYSKAKSMDLFVSGKDWVDNYEPWKELQKNDNIQTFLKWIDSLVEEQVPVVKDSDKQVELYNKTMVLLGSLTLLMLTNTLLCWNCCCRRKRVSKVGLKIKRAKAAKSKRKK